MLRRLIGLIMLVSVVYSLEASTGTFEIKNSSNDTIWIGLINGGTALSEVPVKIPSDQEGGRLARIGHALRPFSRSIDTSKKTELFIWTTKPQEPDPRLLEIGAEFTVSKFPHAGRFNSGEPDFGYTFPTGKNLYLDYHTYGTIRPQKKFFRNNVTLKEIEEITAAKE